MERAELAAFLRTRRQALRPEEVGLPRTNRRRTGGLRREEVASLANMSTDYYSRLEQQRGPRPSEQMLASITRALRLTRDEQAHLFRLAGYASPLRLSRSDGINPGILSVFGRMDDTPVQIMNRLGETLAQNRLSVLLVGDQTRHTGPARALAHRWFTDPQERALFPVEDRARHSRTIVAQLLAAHVRDTTDTRLSLLVDALLSDSAEFAAIWNEHPVIGPHCPPKRVEHPRVGTLELHGQRLVDPDQSQLLIAFTAEPGSESHDKLRSLSVLDEQLV